MRMLAVFSLKIFGNFKFSPYLCTQYQKILGLTGFDGEMNGT